MGVRNSSVSRKNYRRLGEFIKSRPRSLRESLTASSRAFTMATSPILAPMCSGVRPCWTERVMSAWASAAGRVARIPSSRDVYSFNQCSNSGLT
jgi:hypothetical protein